MLDGTRAARIIALPRITRESTLNTMGGLRSYWSALQPAPGVVPPRLAVQPRAIEDMLQAAFLAERTAPGMTRFRVAGRNLVEALGTEPRNLPLTALLTVEAKVAALDLIEEVFAAPAVLELDLRAGDARAAMLIMPLTDYLGRVTMALGGFALDGTAPGAMGQLSLVGRTLTRLPAVSVTQPGCFAIDGIMAAAEAPAPFRGAPRLVHSGDE